MTALPAAHSLLQAEQIGDVTVIKLTARTILDDRLVNVIASQLTNLVENHLGDVRIVIDLGDVERVTTTLFGHLVGLHKKVRALDGRMVLCRIRPKVYEIFEYLKLPRVLEIVKDQQEALQMM